MRIALALVTVALLLGLAHTASAQTCYIVYVHGKGSDLSPGVATDTDRMNYWRRDANDTYANFVTYSSGGCMTLVVGYNGGAAFWETSSAGAVATQINQFITDHNIQPGQLRVIAHSMGGLVMRFILNNSYSGNTYYNYNGDYARIRSVTRYFITLATPHLGSAAADAVYGTSDTICGNFVGTIAGWLGARDNATNYLRRIQLEYASVPSGGWIGDSNRTTIMYTFATRRRDALNNETNDTLLSAAWDCLGMVSHWYGPWSDTPGDGLVTTSSGRAQYERSGSSSGLSWSSGTWVVGRRSTWMEASFDHHQVRHDLEQEQIDSRTPSGIYCPTDGNGSTATRACPSTSYWPGSYIGGNGIWLAP